MRLNRNLGSWDWDALANEFDMENLEEWGFTDNDFDVAIEDIGDEQDANPKIDDTKELQETWGTEKHQIWCIGEHRLLCGDSTKGKEVKSLMGKNTATLCFTSPPYWVGFEYENEKEKESIVQHINKVSENLAVFTKGKIVINTGNIASITTAQKITGSKQVALLIDWWRDALNKNNYLLRHIRVWAKYGRVTPSRANDKIDMHWEYIGMFTEENGNAGLISTFKREDDNIGIKKQTPEWAVTGVWTDIQGNARANQHIASQPVELVERYIKMYTHKNDLMIEPYCGSGSTMVAAQNLGRRCYGMELQPGYCAVILQRMSEAFPNIEIERNEG